MKEKRVLITGASGDLGKVLIPLLVNSRFKVRSLDPLEPAQPSGEFVQGSILDREVLKAHLHGVDLVIHIAAWHGFHEFTGQKTRDEFWDLNMTGTFNLLQGCVENGVEKFLFVSSTSIDDGSSFYGLTKRLGEDLCQNYSEHYGMDILAIRPRAFIPHTNRQVYKSYLEWATWYAKGAIHIDDVAQALHRGAEYLLKSEKVDFSSIEIDGKHDFSSKEIAMWEKEGWDSILKSRFPQYAERIKEIDFAPEAPPTYKDNSKAASILGFEPKFGFDEMLAGFFSS